MATITLTPDHGYVMVTAALMGLQVVTHGFRFAMAGRKAFNKDFHERAKEVGLLDEHKRATGSDKLPEGGYPDMGSGRYSALLNYDQWLALNNGQRAHYNYVEGIASVLTFLALSGVKYPRFAAIAGGVYILGRELYGYGYVSQGPRGRSIGAVLYEVALFSLFGCAVYSGIQVTGLLGN